MLNLCIAVMHPVTVSPLTRYSVKVHDLNAAKAYVLGMGENVYSAIVWTDDYTSYAYHAGIGWQRREWELWEV